MAYFNTTHSTGDELKDYQNKALSQEERILEWFRNMVYPATPSQVQDGALPEAPLTSVRRSLTSLTNQGKLRKLDVQRKGPYGRPEHYWTLQEKGNEFDS